DVEVKRDIEFSVQIFRVRREDLRSLRQKETDWGKILIEEVKTGCSQGKRCVIILDEFQKLRDVYIRNGNGERELLKEFLNLCISLTKERHLSHVAILTSNTVFIEKIYNDARMKETSEFWKVGHLKKEEVELWLRQEGFDAGEIELVWEYLGGSISRLIKVIEARDGGRDIKEFLEHEAWLAYTEIVELLRKIEDKELREGFKSMCASILEQGYYKIKLEEKRGINKAIDFFSEKEILFYDPLELKVTGNSRVYEKGLELVFGNQ
ncbi:MAG: ATP-binding protein, partial [Desulfonauticus sp.]|nr:ATP-binding protein [Desulfonauticus sp.]